MALPLLYANFRRPPLVYFVAEQADRRLAGWLAAVGRGKTFRLEGTLRSFVKSVALRARKTTDARVWDVVGSFPNLQRIQLPADYLNHLPNTGLVAENGRPCLSSLTLLFPNMRMRPRKTLQATMGDLFDLTRLRELSVKFASVDQVTLPWILQLAPTLSTLRVNFVGFTTAADICALVGHHGRTLRHLYLSGHVLQGEADVLETSLQSLRVGCPRLRTFGFDLSLLKVEADPVVPTIERIGPLPDSSAVFKAFLSRGHPTLEEIALGGGDGSTVDGYERTHVEEAFRHLGGALADIDPTTLYKLRKVSLTHVRFPDRGDGFKKVTGGVAARLEAGGLELCDQRGTLWADVVQK